MSVTDKIKIVLVDDHALVRNGIAAMLKQVDDFQIVGTLDSGEQLVNNFKELSPDVIVTDIVMKGMTGIEAARWIKERSEKIKIILLSTEVRKDFVTQGIQAGIDGYLPKDIEKDVLVEAIRRVKNGEKYFNEAITTLVFEDYYNKEKVARQTKQHLQLGDLTEREVQVLSLIASGKSTKEVAEELFISAKTVDTHKGHILDKLGLKNTAELTKYAIKNGLIAM
ncbi:MAG TPA: response regulator transcription factor [Cyclobacteriaceae bacterium]|nr:response regulator transcription factor [Cyclobacteriaceae bacterium]